jgi:hypothetical protein
VGGSVRRSSGGKAEEEEWVFSITGGKEDVCQDGGASNASKASKEGVPFVGGVADFRSAL